MLPMPRASKKLSLPSPASNCCAIGAVEPTAAVFLVQCDAVVTHAGVSQSYCTVITAGRGRCCVCIACCRSACRIAAACSGGRGCICCRIVCGSRCCAAALLRFLCSQGTLFCCVGGCIVGSSGRTTTARGCATPTHWFLINDARTNCSRSRCRTVF